MLSDPFMLIFILGGGIAVALLVIGIVITARSERSLVEERLGRYVEEEAAAAPVRVKPTFQIKSGFIPTWVRAILKNFLPSLTPSR